jgi:hypothetical protein
MLYIFALKQNHQIMFITPIGLPQKQQRKIMRAPLKMENFAFGVNQIGIKVIFV